MCSQVRYHDAMRRGMQHIVVCGCRALLDRLLQLDAEPTHLRILQPRLPGSVQEHTAMCVLQPLPEPTIRLGGTRCTKAVSPVR